MLSEKDMMFLAKAVELAKIALDKGDEPFGSVLVSKEGKILYEGHNEVSGGDHTRHPEFEIARWASNNMNVEDRRDAVVYTSGEHCPMCAAAHGWAGLGKIVYAASSKQLASWLKEFGAPKSRVKTISIEDVINDTIVVGPVKEFEETLKSYHRENYLRKSKI